MCLTASLSPGLYVSMCRRVHLVHMPHISRLFSFALPNSDSASIRGEGPGLPWTFKQVNELSSQAFNPDGKQGARGVAGKKLSEAELAALKAKLAKPVFSKTAPPAPAPAPAAAAEAPRKKVFGLF